VVAPTLVEPFRSVSFPVVSRVNAPTEVPASLMRTTLTWPEGIAASLIYSEMKISSVAAYVWVPYDVPALEEKAKIFKELLREVVFDDPKPEGKVLEWPARENSPIKKRIGDN
jgi:hypothetical protein